MPWWDYLKPQRAIDEDEDEIGRLISGRTADFNPNVRRPNPATLPRAVAPISTEGASDRPPAMVNRPRLPLPAPQPSGIPGGEPPRPAFLDHEIAPPTKSYGHERLDYLDQNSGRGFKQSMKAGSRSGAQSMRDGGRGGGFLGGLIGNLVDPRGEADRAFAAGPGARILQRQEMERGDELYNLKKRGLEASAAENEAQAARYGRPTFKDAAWGTYDESTGQPGYTRPDKPTLPRARKMIPVVDANGKTIYVDENDPNQNWQGLQPYNKPVAERPLPVGEVRRQAEDAVLAEDGSPAQIEEDTWQGRKQAVLDAQLSPIEKQILYEPNKPIEKTRWDSKAGGYVALAEPPTLAEQAAVRKRVQDIEQAERRKIQAGIKGEIQRKADARVSGRAAAPAARGGAKPISRAVVEKYAQDNGISYAEALRDAQADGYVVK